MPAPIPLDRPCTSISHRASGSPSAVPARSAARAVQPVAVTVTTVICRGDRQTLSASTTVASTSTAPDGSFRFTDLSPGSYTLAPPASNFAAPYDGISWLGPTLVTRAIIGAYLWIWAGFAMVLIGTGLSTLPRDALDAARMDGGTEVRVFLQLVLPVARPAIASLAIFQFLWMWNDLLVALLFADSSAQPLTVEVQSQVGQFGSNINVLTPGAFLSLVVPLVVLFAFQRHFVQGVLAGPVK